MSNLLLNPSITIFGFEIYYYAICIVTGMLISAFLSALLMRRRNISYDNIFILFIICIPSAIVGARIFYCVTDGMPLNQWLNIRNGGLSILGGLIGGIGAGFFVCLFKKLNFFRMADCVVPTIPLAQAIGRWGNYFNGEVYGKEVTNELLQFFPFAVEIGNEWHYALFFYESAINLVWFALLFYVAWNYAFKPHGVLTFSMIGFYGIVRTIMEPLRDEDFILGGTDAMYSQMMSILMIILGVGMIVLLLILNKRKEGKFVGSAVGDPYGIREFIKCYDTDEPKYDKWNLATKLYKEELKEKEQDELEE